MGDVIACWAFALVAVFARNSHAQHQAEARESTSAQLCAASSRMLIAHWLCRTTLTLIVPSMWTLLQAAKLLSSLVHLNKLTYCKAVRVGTLSSGLLDSTASRRSSCRARQHSRMMSTNRFGMSSDLLASRRQAMAMICSAARHKCVACC